MKPNYSFYPRINTQASHSTPQTLPTLRESRLHLSQQRPITLRRPQFTPLPRAPIHSWQTRFAEQRPQAQTSAPRVRIATRLEVEAKSTKSSSIIFDKRFTDTAKYSHITNSSFDATAQRSH